MAEFIPTAGYDNCPKCGGWQVLDKTRRKADGWPIGELVYIDCDHCQGRGELKHNRGWANPPPVKEVVTLDNDVAMPQTGWSKYNGK
jgi:hypothetical protein